LAVADTDRAEGQRVLGALEGFGPVLAVKLYRLPRSAAPDVPTLPCLDHEAMLHDDIARHASAYVQEAASGDLHEVAWYPTEHRITIDAVSTWGEHSAESRDRLLARLRDRLPDYRVAVHQPSWWRGDRRVATACSAQVSLRDVLLGEDTAAIRTAIDRLQVIGNLMEKQSRVASWGVRTLTGPMLAGTGVVLYLILGTLTNRIGAAGVDALRYTIIGLLGAWFLYYGLKAVQLTGMANRVWKRTAEFGLILAERKRLNR
jgi:hypothetical protein